MERVDHDCATVTVAEAYAGAVASDPAVPVGPDQLAYIYFTSGSTGAPKGAMCEHAGMLNHLYMKVEDMRLGPGDVVDARPPRSASTSRCGSCWRRCSSAAPPGSSTPTRNSTSGSSSTCWPPAASRSIQIVPAYLDVLLSTVERDPRALGDLRSVSVTGEALRLELVRRWFATYPDIPLVNAYGATEVSDDTMHAVLDRAPERGFVSVGRTLRNVDTYILDEHLRLVPTGAPGEIVFSGVCVGRGYINDPERTAAAFVEDPFRPGTRLYRTGDFGRWLPEGTIEFLGRRDEQVKVRGYRIELGEIESRLLRMPGVGQVAVVITGSDEQSRNLVAFCTGPDTPQPADMRDFVAAAVPEYMVPSYFHRLDELPLTENGKVDKRRLTALAETLGQGAAAFVPPATGDRTTARDRVGRGAQRAGRADRPRRQLLPAGRHLARRGASGGQTGPAGVAAATGQHAGAARPGRTAWTRLPRTGRRHICCSHCPHRTSTRSRPSSASRTRAGTR